MIPIWYGSGRGDVATSGTVTVLAADYQRFFGM